MSIERAETRDGGLIQFGPTYYLLARFADPCETVRIVEAAPAGPSMVDGTLAMRYSDVAG